MSIETVVGGITIYSLGVITGILINYTRSKIDVVIKRENIQKDNTTSIKQSLSSKLTSPSVIHLTPEREAEFAKTRKELEGDL